MLAFRPTVGSIGVHVSVGTAACDGIGAKRATSATRCGSGLGRERTRCRRERCFYGIRRSLYVVDS